MKEKRWYFLWTVPSKSVVCTLNSGVAVRVRLRSSWDIVHNWKKSLQKQLHIVMRENRVRERVRPVSI